LKSRHYFLGPLIVKLASDPMLAHKNLVICAHKEMHRLAKISEETVSLVTQLGIYTVCLNEIESKQGIRFASGKGATVPLHVGSGGKIILSALAEKEKQLILDNLLLERIGPKTITLKAELAEEIKKIKKQGYATSFGERTSGGAGISVLINNYLCPVALCILGPENRLAPKMMSLLEELKHSSEVISRTLLENKLNPNQKSRPSLSKE
jgi:DNA-binding IclR family transcriptional regulator